MKTRNGFVSNSSTSSFIVAGWRLNKEDEGFIDNLKKYLDINDIDLNFTSFINLVKKNLCAIYPKHTIYIEKPEWSDSYFYFGFEVFGICQDGHHKLDLNKMQEYLETAKELAASADLPEPNIYSYSCENR